MSDDGGLARLERRLAAIPKNVRAAVTPILMKQAGEIQRTMKQFAPVDSGDLRDSIEITAPNASTPPFSQPGGAIVVPETSVAITAGSEEVRYPHLVEFGHKASGFNAGGKDVPAQPFFWPAVRLHNKKAKRAIKAAIGRAVRKDWGK